MISSPPSFLDLVSLREIGETLLDPRPAWVWRADGTRLLWANAAAAARLGATRIAPLLQREASPDDPLARQIARIARTLPAGPARMELLRLKRDGGTDPIACACSRLELDGDAILCLGARALPDHEPAAALVAALVEGRGGAAVTDAAGRILAAAGLSETGLDALSRLVLDVEQTGERLIRSTEEIDGADRRAGVARVGTPDGDWRYLVILGPPIGEAESELPDADLPEAEPPAPEPAAPAIVSQPTETAPPAASDTIAGPPEPAESAPAAAEAAMDELPVAPAGSAHGAMPAPLAPQPVSTQPADTSDAPADTVLPEAAGGAAAAMSAPPSAAMAGSTPIRFVFQTDAEGTFTLVSDAFAAAVGPHAADLVGQRWQDVAARLGLDDAAVSAALARRDTWSGITLRWPVDGSAETVAVDLSALPVFTRDRRFDGFRGFGICRPADRKPRPAAHAAATEQPAAAPEAEPQPATAEVDAPELAMPPSNVVRLPGVPAPIGPVPARLNGLEQDAFRRIAEALGTAAGQVPALPEAADEPDLESPADPVPQPATVEPTGGSDGGAPAGDWRLLDRLPLGVAVLRDQEPVLVNRTLLDLVGHPTLEAFRTAGGIDALFAGAGPWSGGTERPDGERLSVRTAAGDLPVEARLRTVPWGAGSALMLTVRETRDERAAIEAEDASAAEDSAGEARALELEAILDTATDGVVVLDAAARIQSLNRSAEALFGVESAAMTGTPFVALFAEESQKAALDYLDGLASNGVASVLNDGREMIGKVPRGGLIPLFMTVGRIGATGKFCAVLRDITHWKNAEEELTNARRAAEAANSQKSEFLAKISHEIRTPLNAVIGFSEVMMQERFGPIENERYRQYLRDIHLSGSHLMSLINDLLDLSKIEAGKLELAFEAVAPNDVIRECVALMQPQANQERIIIRTSLSAGLPSIVADPRSLRQIVLNLLSNAIKFTLPGGQVIVSSSLEENGEVVLRIRDTGVGMSEKDIDAALKPFRQLATSGRTPAEGTGLGLPLTKALAEANRASFAIDSAVDQGTMVRITFPITRVLAG